MSNIAFWTGNASTAEPQVGLQDRYGRRLNYLRVSVTDRCNLRCVYCMPEDMKFQPKSHLMTDQEIIDLVGMMAELGVTKIRLTGGEPVVRPNLVEIVRSIKQLPGIQEISMTTNSLLLPQLAEPLARAGLDRVNISIDTLNPAKFKTITRWGDLDAVWAGVEAAEAAGLQPIKINTVVTRGFNDDEVVELARLSLDRAWQIRFIELMPFGSEADFAQESVVSSIESRGTIEACAGTTPGSPRLRWQRPCPSVPISWCPWFSWLYKFRDRAILCRMQSFASHR